MIEYIWMFATGFMSGILATVGTGLWFGTKMGK